MLRLFLVFYRSIFQSGSQHDCLLSVLDISGLLLPRMAVVLKGACLFSVLLNNFVNESMLSGLSLQDLKTIL